MHAEDVLGDKSIALLVHVVGNDEKEIETTEEGVGEGDVLVRVLVNVVLSVDRVGSGDDRTARVERGVDAGLRDGDRLLLHDFVDGDAIDLRHLVELVDADDSAVGENHGAGFKTAFACELLVRCCEEEKAERNAPVSLSVVTAAVSPTPEDPRPVVAIARGAVLRTKRSI